MKPTANSILNLGRVVALPLVGLAFAVPAIAQSQGDAFLEEIVVTAQKREQNIMDVPVAITAVTGAQIQESGIKDMFDLQQNVPGLIVGQSQTATTSNFSIRGIGSTSNNFGVESSVGLYVDGVYRSRQSSMINELIDVQAVEVLRGPQGTLFGKNTASGAISIRTVAPSSDSSNSFVEFTTGDLGLARLSAATNIALTDKLALRGTIFSSKRDGYVHDDVLGQEIYNDRDRLGVRLQLGYDNGEDFDMRIIADYAEIDETCCVGISRVDALFAQGVLGSGQVVPGADAARLQLGGTVYTDFPYPMPLPPTVRMGVGFEEYRTAMNAIPNSTNEDMGLSVEFNKDFGGVTLTSVTALRSFDTFDFIDADFTDTLIIERTNAAEQQSISQELRLAGEFGEGSNWVLGGYYFAQTLDSNTRTTGQEQLQDYVFLVQPDLQAAVDGINLVSALTGGALPEAADPFPLGMFADDIVMQDHDGYAVFGQVDWALSEAFTFTLGARYTTETKDIDTVYTQTNPGLFEPDLLEIGTTLFLLQNGLLDPVNNPADAATVVAAFTPTYFPGWGGYLFAPFSPRLPAIDTLEDDQVTGTAKLTWYPSDDLMFYASYATGFKAGGTNADRIWDFLDQVFLPETSNSIEIGFKGDLGDRLRVSASIFHTDYDDFQAQSFTGTGFYLQNAGNIETKGVEIEWTWQALENTEISGYYAHNEGEYKSFEEGVCWDSWPFHNQQDDPGRIPATPGVPADEMPCRRTGSQIPYNPEDRFFLSVMQTVPMGANELFFKAEYTWASEQFTDGDLDPFTLQDDLGLLNVRFGLNMDEWNSTLTVWGRNVTDERWYGGSFDVPLMDGRMNSYPAEPATFGVTFRKNWD